MSIFSPDCNLLLIPETLFLTVSTQVILSCCVYQLHFFLLAVLSIPRAFILVIRQFSLWPSCKRFWWLLSCKQSSTARSSCCHHHYYCNCTMFLSMQLEPAIWLRKVFSYETHFGEVSGMSSRCSKLNLVSYGKSTNLQKQFCYFWNYVRARLCQRRLSNVSGILR